MAQDKKREIILEAAQKRFSHFGVDKTTMNEIADDLSLSKASLYYYFPDKLNLYAAVLSRIIEAEQVNERHFDKEKNTEKALLKFLEARTESIIKNHNILEHIRTIGTSFPPEFQTVFSAARTRDLQIISSIITKGLESKTLKVKNAAKAAELLLDCLDGLRHFTFWRKINFFPEKTEFYNLLKREQELASIFIRGISVKS